MSGIVALVQGAKALSIGVQKLQSLNNAPDEFKSLLNEMSALQAYLELVDGNLEMVETQVLQTPMPRIDPGPLDGLLIELQQITKELADFAEQVVRPQEVLGYAGQS